MTGEEIAEFVTRRGWIRLDRPAGRSSSSQASSSWAGVVVLVGELVQDVSHVFEGLLVVEIGPADVAGALVGGGRELVG
jgi:hypothetical protein